MKLREEIVYMSLENKYLYCIPVVYREMLQSLSSIKESISFNYNVIDIYHQPLFCVYINVNYNFLSSSIYFSLYSLSPFFLCYEVKTGFLPDNAIVEMVTNVKAINFDFMSGNCKPPLLFSHIMVLYFTRCAPMFYGKTFLDILFIIY
jgi:hypothetical protein